MVLLCVGKPSFFNIHSLLKGALKWSLTFFAIKTGFNEHLVHHCARVLLFSLDKFLESGDILKIAVCG